ncbi:hypothetical protein ABEB36_001261 [Hypothenemus hampei]|uniref:Cirhin n=1 Tax=Hypothenemus hampei TaxID=57062 RepID=A0ABD1FDZ3_HYPHA
MIVYLVGDSRGVLTLWDGKIGAQIESYQSHHADITAICVDTNECSIYAAGVDPLISNYEKVKVGSNFRWVKSIQRKIHEHDVRTMVIHKGRLYSAGLDSYLVCSYYPPKTLIKYAPILQTPCIQVTSSTSRRILLRYSNYLEVWSLSRTQNVPSNFKGIVEPEERPKKLLTLQKLGKNWAEEDEAESIVCASISSNGKWIFLGSCTGFRLYSFELAKTKPKLTKIEDLDDSNVPCVQAAFNDKRNQLIIALNSGKLIVYDLENNDPFIFQRIEVENGQLSDTVSLLTVSTCGKYLVIADAKSNITVFKYTKDGYSFLVKLPKYQASPTALSVNSTTGCLVVAYADYKVWEYSLQNKHLTGLSKKLESTPGWKVRTHTIRSITFDSKQSIFLHDDSSIIVIVREVSGAKEVEKKLKKEQSMHNGFGEDVLQIRSISKYKHLVHLGNVAEDEFVAVEVNPLSILKNLPPAFAQKTFGSK